MWLVLDPYHKRQHKLQSNSSSAINHNYILIETIIAWLKFALNGPDFFLFALGHTNC